MKRLLFLTFLSIVAAASTGCFHNCCAPKKQQCRPACAPVANPCCTPGDSYATPGIITTAPTLSVPQNYAPAVVPGPAAYVPAQ
jgi:hypothetical protein